MSRRDIVCEDLPLAIEELKREGFRLDLIYPADDPAAAVMSRGEEIACLATSEATELPARVPQFQPEFVLSNAGTQSGQGRAGMLYRDLIPGRLGGRYIASHISIPRGGPVSDWVHYHRISLQIIYVRRGWIRVVYQDQGEPFVLNEGDVVLQPPQIRHQVLESSPGLEVVEVSAPAIHATYADHGLELPNGSNPGRIYGGQYFLHHIASETAWTSADEGLAQETEVWTATSGLAAVRTLRPRGTDSLSFGGHGGELVFGFVVDGSAMLDYRGLHEVGPAASFVIPPGQPWKLTHPTADFRLLHVTTAPLD